MKMTLLSRLSSLFVLLLIFWQCSSPETQETGETQETQETEVVYFRVDRFDDQLLEWVGDSAHVEILADGFVWSEGPLWLESENKLLFSDVPTNTVHAWTEADGLSTYLKPSGYTGAVERGGEMGSNGLILDRDGKLLLCQHGDRRVARMTAPLSDPSSEFETLADSWDGKRLNSPNDLVVADDGAIYFTDPPYGLEGNMDDPAKELAFQGVYKITPDGRVILLTDSISRPNGIEISQDGQYLYIGNSDSAKPWWLRYTITGDSLSEGHIFADPTRFFENAGGSDGMVVAGDGTLISTGHGGIWFITPEGEVLGRIQIPQAVANCTLDSTESYLYVTAHTQVLRIRLGN